MSTIHIEEMAAGEDETTIWVSLGFKSDISPFDVLFIVCGKSADAQQIQHGMDRLYFERFDQGMSLYDAADSIELGASEVTIHFTPAGTKRLRFPETVRFDLSVAAEPSGSVTGNLKKMRAFPSGSIITEGRLHEFAAEQAARKLSRYTVVRFAFFVCDERRRQTLGRKI